MNDPRNDLITKAVMHKAIASNSPNLMVSPQGLLAYWSVSWPVCLSLGLACEYYMVQRPFQSIKSEDG